LDQALVLIGACFDNSGINVLDTLKNDNFKPHVALKPLLEWLSQRASNSATRNAASRAVSISLRWAATQAPKPKQASLVRGLRAMKQLTRFCLATAWHQLDLGRRSIGTRYVPPMKS
jgi:hypothetical protein